MITKPNLNTKDTAGVVGQPAYKDGVAELISTKSADMTNSGTNINQTASSENRSAKFKNPQAKADVADKAQGQYM